MPDSVNWSKVLLQSVISAAFIVVPILLAGWLGYKKLWWTLTEYRPHRHSEDNGHTSSLMDSLTVEGIQYPRNMRDRK